MSAAQCLSGGSGKEAFLILGRSQSRSFGAPEGREGTSEFRDRYRFRAGIEGTISAYEARTGVKQLRVRGFEAVRFCATLKATGVNIFRASAVRREFVPGQRHSQVKFPA